MFRIVYSSLIMIFVLYSHSYAECFCDPIHFVKDAKLIVRARIIESTSAFELEQCKKKSGKSDLLKKRAEPCAITFTAEVQEVLRGAVDPKILKFTYSSYLSEDEDIFNVGTEPILLIADLKENSTASLFKYHCMCSVIWPQDRAMMERLKEEIVKHNFQKEEAK